MLEAGQKAPDLALVHAPGKPWLVVFLETDCPTCWLSVSYLNKLAKQSISVFGISQDDAALTRRFVEQAPVAFPVEVDHGLRLSRAYDPVAVPAFFLIGGDGRVIRSHIGFDKDEMNAVAAELGCEPVADPYDGAPKSKPGCSSRHLEPSTDGAAVEPVKLHATRGTRASRIEISEDACEYSMRAFGDALPVVPPTAERVDAMMGDLDPAEIVGRIPPCYGEATVEKIAANAVMAGCAPSMMRVLIPLVRAVCDERFNAHGVQATTHFAAPLIVVNGPIRNTLGFAYRKNVFSNVARANSSLGRALQLILLNLGGGRPDGIDMSVLGNPGKFSYCIAENEEENPWEPLHVELGFARSESTVTLFAGEAPHGVSEHMSRTAQGVLKAVSRALATVWSYRTCMSIEAVVVLCPEHVKTIHRDGFTKNDAREFLFRNTGIPVRDYAARLGRVFALADEITIINALTLRAKQRRLERDSTRS